MARMWSADQATSRPAPVEKPVNSALAALKLNIEPRDFVGTREATDQNGNSTVRLWDDNEIQAMQAAQRDSNAPPLKPRLLYGNGCNSFPRIMRDAFDIHTVFPESRKNLTLNECYKRKADDNSPLSVTILPLSVEWGKVNTAEKFTAVQQAAHDFLSTQGVKLLPPNPEDFIEARKSSVAEANIADGSVTLRLNLDPTQKVSELGTNGEKLFNSMLALSKAVQQARSRGVLPEGV